MSVHEFLQNLPLIGGYFESSSSITEDATAQTRQDFSERTSELIWASNELEILLIDQRYKSNLFFTEDELEKKKKWAETFRGISLRAVKLHNLLLVNSKHYLERAGEHMINQFIGEYGRFNELREEYIISLQR